MSASVGRCVSTGLVRKGVRKGAGQEGGNKDTCGCRLVAEWRGWSAWGVRGVPRSVLLLAKLGVTPSDSAMLIEHLPCSRDWG